ncbi:hypothetical protein L228DRAFT_247551 [Xylona heveae TC161]|uniref:Uncharacterized protein n=1 Tax=Xylona heveae (strain CBS 132557 / TC161) TaxID=1328760 RepID=A0A165H7M3_XYLHT|nr:hypothetical protein L228DRAFT_247551 [Xylona heveae TC161]KZF23098.1 hypothetical protein L228DRAFT_247551 [Xylona heveae TC161]
MGLGHRLAALPTRLGLTWHNLLTMIKSALPATICMAAFQSTTWAEHFGPLNYLVAIEALLGFCILPRARFIQVMVLDVFMVCLATAVNLLALWTSVQARKHTTSPGDNNEYNSSASAVCAIWFTLQIYFTNALRSSRPQFQFPCINYTIFALIALAQAGPGFRTMDEARSFMSLLLQSFLVGFGVATAVSLLILPHSNRDIAFGAMRKYISSIEEVVSVYTESINNAHSKGFSGDTQTLHKFKAKHMAMKGNYVKLGADLEFAVRDVGFGRLNGKDLKNIFEHLRTIHIPLLGLQDLPDTLCTDDDLPACLCKDGTAFSLPLEQQWGDFAQASANLAADMIEALKFIVAVLLDNARSKEHVDPENGDALLSNISCHEARLSQSAAALVQCAVLNTPTDALHTDEKHEHCHSRRHKSQKAISVQQSTQFMLYHSTRATASMLTYIQEKAATGSLNKKRLILPTTTVLIQWARDILAPADSSTTEHILDSSLPRQRQDTLNAALYGQDPQHLPAQTFLEHIGELFRKIPALLRTSHSYFGFRAACATMSLAIISYLHQSHVFFVKERVLWAIVMTSIAMNATTGHTAHNFFLRVLASVAGTIGSYVCWYIVDERPAGVIVFMFIYMAGSFYWCVVKPKYALLAIVSAVTPLISVGYALNVQKLGVQTLEKEATPGYPMYKIAAFRFVNVLAGLAVAAFWTVFPYPITDASVMRSQIGGCAYLMARYNAIVSETLLTKDRILLQGELAEKLSRARINVLQQAQAHIVKLKASPALAKMNITVGGRFPVEAYREAIRLLDQILTQMAVVGYASSTLVSDAETGSGSSDATLTKSTISSFDYLLQPARTLTSALCLLSASIINGLPLAPYAPLAEPFDDHIPATPTLVEGSPPKAVVDTKALPVIHVAVVKTYKDLQLLRKAIAAICGELDFSLRGLSEESGGEVDYNLAEEMTNEE